MTSPMSGKPSIISFNENALYKGGKKHNDQKVQFEAIIRINGVRYKVRINHILKGEKTSERVNAIASIIQKELLAYVQTHDVADLDISKFVKNIVLPDQDTLNSGKTQKKTEQAFVNKSPPEKHKAKSLESEHLAVSSASRMNVATSPSPTVQAKIEGSHHEAQKTIADSEQVQKDAEEQLARSRQLLNEEKVEGAKVESALAPLAEPLKKPSSAERQKQLIQQFEEKKNKVFGLHQAVKNASFLAQTSKKNLHLQNALVISYFANEEVLKLKRDAANHYGELIQISDGRAFKEQSQLEDELSAINQFSDFIGEYLEDERKKLNANSALSSKLVDEPKSEAFIKLETTLEANRLTTENAKNSIVAYTQVNFLNTQLLPLENQRLSPVKLLEGRHNADAALAQSANAFEQAKVHLLSLIQLEQKESKSLIKLKEAANLLLETSYQFQETQKAHTKLARLIDDYEAHPNKSSAAPPSYRKKGVTIGPLAPLSTAPVTRTPLPPPPRHQPHRAAASANYVDQMPVTPHLTTNNPAEVSKPEPREDISKASSAEIALPKQVVPRLKPPPRAQATPPPYKAKEPLQMAPQATQRVQAAKPVESQASFASSAKSSAPVSSTARRDDRERQYKSAVLEAITQSSAEKVLKDEYDAVAKEFSQLANQTKQIIKLMKTAKSSEQLEEAKKNFDDSEAAVTYKHRVLDGLMSETKLRSHKSVTQIFDSQYQDYVNFATDVDNAYFDAQKRLEGAPVLSEKRSVQFNLPSTSASTTTASASISPAPLPSRPAVSAIQPPPLPSILSRGSTKAAAEVLPERVSAAAPDANPSVSDVDDEQNFIERLKDGTIKTTLRHFLDLAKKNDKHLKNEFSSFKSFYRHSQDVNYRKEMSSIDKEIERYLTKTNKFTEIYKLIAKAIKLVELQKNIS